MKRGKKNRIHSARTQLKNAREWKSKEKRRQIGIETAIVTAEESEKNKNATSSHICDMKESISFVCVVYVSWVAEHIWVKSDGTEHDQEWERDIRLSMWAGMLWVNVFNARLNGFCRYIILRLFHNIFHIFSFATSAECSACLWSSCEWNRFRWDWKHSNHMKPETVIFHRLTSKLIPFHYVSMCARFFFFVCAAVVHFMCHSLFLFTFSDLGARKLLFHWRHSQPDIECMC